MKTQLSKAILFNFFSGHHTSMQKKMVEEWLASPENTELYYEWLEEWEREHPQYQEDTNKALTSFLAKLSEPSIATLPVAGLKENSFRLRLFRISYSAAAIALLMIGYYFLAGDFIPYKTYQSGFGEVQRISLSDGSTVVLNANSILRIPRFGFGSTTRVVFLKGQAEFNVQHKKDNQKFLVHTPDRLEIEVVGTEFVVFSRERGSQVILNKGKVLLRSLDDTVKRSLVVKPGDVVTIKKGQFNVKENQPLKPYAAWKEHRFIFDRTPLKEIAYQVKENFGVTLQIQDTIVADRELTGTFEAVDADELLDVLAKVLDVEISKSSKNTRVIKR
jgi:transmembrane sensor